MKIKAYLTFGILMGFLLSFTTVPSENMVHDPSGTYSFTVTDIPDLPDVTGEMVLSKENGVAKLTMTSDGTTSTLEKVVLSGHDLSGELNYQGMVLKLKGKFSGDNFKGVFITDFGDMGVTAVKK